MTTLSIQCKTARPDAAEVKDGDTVQLEDTWIKDNMNSVASAKDQTGKLEATADKLSEAETTADRLTQMTEYMNQVSSIAKDLQGVLFQMLKKLQSPTVAPGVQRYASVPNTEFAAQVTIVQDVQQKKLSEMQVEAAKFATMASAQGTSLQDLIKQQKKIGRQIDDVTTALGGVYAALERWFQLASGQQGGGGNSGNGNPGGGGNNPPPAPEVVKVAIDGFVVAGDNIQYNSGQAQSSWQTRCDALETKLREIIGSDKLETFDCGDSSNVTPWASSSYYLYWSNPTAVVVTRGQPDVQKGATITGDNVQYDRTKAQMTWYKKCEDGLLQLKNKHGARFIAASCGTPSNVTPWTSSNYFQYSSTMKVWLSPLSSGGGTATDIAGFYVSGSNVQYDKQAASDSWQKECDSLEEFLRTLIGDSLVGFDCGEQSNVTPWTSSNYYQYASAPVLKVALPTGILEQGGATITGENVQYDSAKATSTWVTQCKDALQKAKQTHGQRFVAGACGQPSNVTPWSSSNYFQYSSKVKLWLKPLAG